MLKNDCTKDHATHMDGKRLHKIKSMKSLDHINNIHM